MDSQKVDLFMMTKGKYFSSEYLPELRERLVNANEMEWQSIQMIQFKDPTTSLIASLLAGHFGLDRFLIGDTGKGIGKLLTCGGIGIWTIVDWFLIMGATREGNLRKLDEVLF